MSNGPVSLANCARHTHTIPLYRRWNAGHQFRPETNRSPILFQVAPRAQYAETASPIAWRTGVDNIYGACSTSSRSVMRVCMSPRVCLLVYYLTMRTSPLDSGRIASLSLAGMCVVYVR